MATPTDERGGRGETYRDEREGPLGALSEQGAHPEGTERGGDERGGGAVEGTQDARE